MKLEQIDREHIVADVLMHGLSTAFVAKQFKISHRRIQQVVQYTRKEGCVPILQKGGGHPYAQYPKDIRKIVVKTKKRLMHVPDKNMAKEEVNERVRKKRWVRDE